MQPAARLSVGITTRNRFESLVRSVRSLGALAGVATEIIIVDDCSTDPVEAPLRRQLAGDFAIPVTVVRCETARGPIVARNEIARRTREAFLLSLDDDAFILDPKAVVQAIDVMERDRQVAAVAFAQANDDGTPWPASMQPSLSQRACCTTTYIGFAALLRKETFLSLGGYHERLVYMGEEKEYCLRLLDAGYHVVYLPDARVAHCPDPRGRDGIKYLRYYMRNDCLGAVYNYPWPLALAMVARRFLSYPKTARSHMGLEDPEGRRWLARELRTHLRAILRERHAVAWRTILEWQRLKQSPGYDLEPVRSGPADPLPNEEYSAH